MYDTKNGDFTKETECPVWFILVNGKIGIYYTILLYCIIDTSYEISHTYFII